MAVFYHWNQRKPDSLTEFLGKELTLGKGSLQEEHINTTDREESTE